MPTPLIERHIRPTVVEALTEARAVCLLGARQAGKSTLVRAIADREHPAEYLTLDDEATRRSAREDPTGFIANVSGSAVIDEVQRAPDLMLAIKERLDTNNERGQFLLAGSANILHPSDDRRRTAWTSRLCAAVALLPRRADRTT